MWFIKDGVIENYTIIGGKVAMSAKVGGRWVSNPDYETFLSWGWTPYTPPVVQDTPDYERLYEQRVVELIRELYSEDDEFAILRQRDTKPDEFQIYFDYCEQCKEQARREIAEMQESGEEEEGDDEE